MDEPVHTAMHQVAATRLPERWLLFRAEVLADFRMAHRAVVIPLAAAIHPTP